jgi:hypothetical protein
MCCLFAIRRVEYLRMGACRRRVDLPGFPKVVVRSDVSSFRRALLSKSLRARLRCAYDVVFAVEARLLAGRTPLYSGAIIG